VASHPNPPPLPAGSARDETAYTAADEEDAELLTAAQKAARRRNLAVNPLEEDSDDDDEGDDEDDEAGARARRMSGAGAGAGAGPKETEDTPPQGATGKKPGRKPAGAAGDLPGPAYTAAQAAAQLQRGLAGLSDAADGIDELEHTCSVTISLPLHAPKLLMLEVVEKVAAAVMVQETQGIEKVSLVSLSCLPPCSTLQLNCLNGNCKKWSLPGEYVCCPDSRTHCPTGLLTLLCGLPLPSCCRCMCCRVTGAMRGRVCRQMASTLWAFGHMPTW
jgi:hypothetical protein